MRRSIVTLLTLLVLVSTTPSAFAVAAKTMPVTTINVTDAPVTLTAFRGTAKRRQFHGLTLEIQNTSNRPIYSLRYLVSVDVTGLEFPVGMHAVWGDSRFDVESVVPAADQPAIAPGASARLTLAAVTVGSLNAYLDSDPAAEIRSVTIQPDCAGFGDGEGWVTGLYFDRKTMGPIPDQSATDAEKVALPCTSAWLYFYIGALCDCADRSYNTFYINLVPLNRREDRTCFVPGTNQICTFKVIVGC
jgi:hypothetical protein